MPRRRTSPPLFPRGRGVGARAVLVIVLALGVWVADQRGFPLLTAVRGSVDWLLQPLHWAGNVPGDLAHAGGELKNYRELLEENKQLRASQLTAQARLLKLDALEAENRRIRQLMASSSALDQKVLIAEIIATTQSPCRHQITLNKGAGEGVYFGQAVVDAYGIMGQVIRVNPTSSIALLVTDPSHGIPVEVNRTGLQTVARGGGDGRVLTLPYLPGNADVKVGDLLVSSGLGGRFPAGYPVGEIFDIRRTTGEHFMEATAYPSARLNQGRQALLVWSSAPPAVSAPQVADDAAGLAAQAAQYAAARAPAAVTLPGTASTAANHSDTPSIPLRHGAVTSKPSAASAPTSPKPAAVKPAAPKPAAVRPAAAAAPSRTPAEATVTIPAQVPAPSPQAEPAP